jgi:hypothetical protein
MSQHKPWWRKRLFSIFLSLMVIGCLVFFFSVNTSATSRLQLLWRQARGLSSEAVPTGRGAGGAGRGPICVLSELAESEGARSVVALMPVIEAGFNQNRVFDGGDLDEGFSRLNGSEAILTSESPTEGYVGGYTLEEQPEFWFYVPYVADSGSTEATERSRQRAADTSPEEDSHIRIGKFALLDEGRNLIASHLVAIELLSSPRLVAFQLPNSLEPNQLYNWHFSIVCEPEKPSRNPVVRGWVERLESTPALATALQTASPTQRYLTYAENGIWLEAVSELVAIRQRFLPMNPMQREQIQQDWFDLLVSVNISSPEAIDLRTTEPVAVKADARLQSQVPARM